MIPSLMLLAMIPSQSPAPATSAKVEYPQIKGYGGVVPLPSAPNQPRKGTKVVFEVAAGAKPDGVNKGLERAARFVNVMALGGLKATDYKATVVLHGEATQAVLTDAAYAARFKAKANPNLALVRRLKEAGVEVAVCGQALAMKGFKAEEVAPDVKVVLAAVTLVIERQAEGYAYICVP